MPIIIGIVIVVILIGYQAFTFNDFTHHSMTNDSKESFYEEVY